jgi:large subunit ribosomal protein L17
MKHGKKFNHLGRKKGHREAMLSNMAASLIIHKRINTTLAKAKALRLYVEPLVTKAKANSTHARRVVFSYLGNKDAIHELFSTVREKVGERPGGYVRVIRMGTRPGDGAETAMIEFVDFNTHYSNASDTAAAAPQKKRTRRGKAKTAAEAEAPAETTTETTETEE